MRLVAVALVLMGCAVTPTNELGAALNETDIQLPSNAVQGGKSCGNVYERISMGEHVYNVALPCETNYVDTGDPPPERTMEQALSAPMPLIERR